MPEYSEYTPHEVSTKQSDCNPFHRVSKTPNYLHSLKPVKVVSLHFLLTVFQVRRLVFWIRFGIRVGMNKMNCSGSLLYMVLGNNKRVCQEQKQFDCSRKSNYHRSSYVNQKPDDTSSVYDILSAQAFSLKIAMDVHLQRNRFSAEIWKLPDWCWKPIAWPATVISGSPTFVVIGREQ